MWLNESGASPMMNMPGERSEVLFWTSSFLWIGLQVDFLSHSRVCFFEDSYGMGHHDPALSQMSFRLEPINACRSKSPGKTTQVKLCALFLFLLSFSSFRGGLVHLS